MIEPTYTDMLASLGVGGAHPGGFELTKIILQNENLTKKMKILDVGCGTGQTSAFLVKNYNCNVTALDSHNIMFEKAKKRFEKENLAINLFKKSAESIPVKDENFHFVIAESVLAFTNIHLSLPEIMRVLKRSGKLLAIEMVAIQELSLKEKSEIKTVYNIKNILLESEWKNLFTQTGFTSVAIHQNNLMETDVTENEHDPSPSIDPKIFKILEKHSELMQRYQEKLSYRVFHCVK